MGTTEEASRLRETLNDTATETIPPNRQRASTDYLGYLSMQAPDVRFSHDPFSHGQRVDFPAGRPRILTVAFALLWFAGWLFLFLQLALHYQRFGTANVPAFVLALLAGAPAAIAVVWAVFGKRESLIVTPSHVHIYRWVGPMRLSRSISAATVVGLSAATIPTGPT